MAKGLRAKGKRANRSSLRATFVHPKNQKAQAAVSEKMQQNMDTKIECPSILKLKNALGGSTADVSVKEVINEVEEDEEEAEDEDAKRQRIKEKLIAIQKNKKGGNKRNPGKKLEWFS